MICGNSSTIDSAILCRMPVIGPDYAVIEYSAYADSEAVVKRSRPDTLFATLVRCQQNGEYLRSAREAIVEA
jgi:hypothetical protein